jgi:hypothetical protein
VAVTSPFFLLRWLLQKQGEWDLNVLLSRPPRRRASL